MGSWNSTCCASANRTARRRARSDRAHVGIRAEAAKTLDLLEVEADRLAADAFGIGHIAIGCALSIWTSGFRRTIGAPAARHWRRGMPRLRNGHRRRRPSTWTPIEVQAVRCSSPAVIPAAAFDQASAAMSGRRCAWRNGPPAISVGLSTGIDILSGKCAVGGSFPRLWNGLASSFPQCASGVRSCRAGIRVHARRR